tara:strand:+ start:1389 stop:1550 length:162 start_codon:yes stop_codon:yes gene_type:complete
MSRLVNNPKDRAAYGALTTPTLSHDTEGFALEYVETKTIDCPHKPFVRGEIRL